MIAIGDRGDYVRCWQRVVGVAPINCDGAFGPHTDQLVKLWQLKHGVEADGVIGALTRAALEPGDLIKPYEGLVLVTYDDAQDVPLSHRLLTLDAARQWRRPDGSLLRGYATIGWGRQLWPGEYITSCTRDEADRWFAEDLEKTRLPAVRRLSITEPGRIAAACSFAYNGGTGALGQLMAGDVTRDEWLSYCHARVDGKKVVDRGLMMRRAEEWALWDNAA